ncbi:hypothetical protein AVEN_60917-1 [Araneus ventricosus]|uniref:Uncharacterized protein n=1 Tax=Araneus ventricosus TaxID=182803 RepID=A0A4Y2F8F0_ARAVE|nr:hypothetical protein AVEN_60917-1 [Araneus ventricosus]
MKFRKDSISLHFMRYAGEVKQLGRQAGWSKYGFGPGVPIDKSEIPEAREGKGVVVEKRKTFFGRQSDKSGSTGCSPTHNTSALMEKRNTAS